MRTTLDTRVAALETALEVSAERCYGVLVLHPGETKDEALERVGPGCWLVVPGVCKDSAAWAAMVQNNAGEVRGVTG